MTEPFNHIKETTTASKVLHDMINTITTAEKNEKNKLTYVYEMIKSAVTGRIPTSHLNIANDIDAMYPNYHRVYEIADENKRREALFKILQDEKL